MTGLGEYCRCVLDWLSSTLRLISTSTLWTARVQKCREYFARQTPFVKYSLHCRVKVLYARNFAPGTLPQECSIRFFLKSTRGCTNVLKAPVLAVVVITNIQGRNYHRVSYLLNMYAVTCALVAIRGEVHVGCTRLAVGAACTGCWATCIYSRYIIYAEMGAWIVRRPMRAIAAASICLHHCHVGCGTA